MDRWEDHLTDEIARINSLGGLESQARAVRRAIMLTNHAEKEFKLLRNSIMRRLRFEYDWSLADVGAYFRMSRERARQLTQPEGGLGNDGEPC